MAKRKLLLDAFLPYRLSFTSNAVSEAIARAYEALFGLKIPEWRLIAVIAEHRGITQQAIGLRTRMDKVTVSRAAIALTERGLVERRPNPQDQRSHLLVLSKSGRVLYAEVVPKALELEARIFGGFDAAEITAFVEMLRRIDAAALQTDGGEG
jgi:DNA-binding MarR family transcriptional regulator